MSSGRIWPYAIGISITMVFGFCVATIMVTQTANIQESDAYMTYYQDADANANELIEAKIAFDKKYNVEYFVEHNADKSIELKYKLTDKMSKPVDNAAIVIATSRPETDEYNKRLDNPNVENGLYSFSNLSFEKIGVWNIVAKIEIDKESRFFNIKTNTQTQETFEF